MAKLRCGSVQGIELCKFTNNVVDNSITPPNPIKMYRLRPFASRLTRVAQQQKRQLSIHEYLSADLLRKSGVGVPYGAVAETAEEAEAIAKKIGGDDMVNAFSLSGRYYCDANRRRF